LIETVFKFKKYPIISAIGHQIDNPLLDLVADISCPTPSLAAKFLIDYNKNFIKKLTEIKYDFYNKIKTDFFSEEKRLNDIKNKLKTIINNLFNINYSFKNSIEKELFSKKEELKLIKNKVNFNLNCLFLSFSCSTFLCSSNLHFCSCFHFDCCILYILLQYLQLYFFILLNKV
jgi:exodeoxyribonuclease VII large subunit